MDERITFTWDFVTTLMDFYDKLKGDASIDSFLFTKRERYILSILSKTGLPENSNVYVMIMTYAELYNTKTYVLFPMHPTRTTTSIFAPC